MLTRSDSTKISMAAPPRSIDINNTLHLAIAYKEALTTEYGVTIFTDFSLVPHLRITLYNYSSSYNYSSTTPATPPINTFALICS